MKTTILARLAAPFAMLALLIGSPNPAWTSIITYEFSGEVTTVDTRNGFAFAASEVEIGSPITGQFSFDPVATSDSVSNPLFGRYEFPFGSIDFQMSVGSLLFIGSVGKIEVGTGPGAIGATSGPIDFYEVNITGFDTIAGSIFPVFAGLGYDLATNLETDALPLIPPPIRFGSLFLTGSAMVGGQLVDAFDVRGPLDQLVLTTIPEPSTLALFTVGLAGFGFMGRRRRGYSPLGGGTVVRFPRIWMSSGKCRLKLRRTRC